MFKKIFYSFTILAMLFGMFGVMGKGGVQTAQAESGAGGNFANAFGGGAVWLLNPVVALTSGPLSVVGTTVFGANRQITDPTDCLAGNSTGWSTVQTSAANVNFLTVAVYARFDASVVITNAAGTIVRGCFNVAKNTGASLTIPAAIATQYQIMVSEKQGYPFVALETFDYFVMQSRYSGAIITHIVGGPAGIFPIVRNAADGSAPVAPGGFGVAASDTNGASFFDVPAGAYNVAWSATIGVNFAMFQALAAPNFARFNPATATVATYVTADGGTGTFNLWLAPSAWVSGALNWQAPQTQGIGVVGCQGLNPYPLAGSACWFSVVPGTYDAQLFTAAVVGVAPFTYYDLAVINRPLTNLIFPGENIDFRFGILPQEQITLDKANALFLDLTQLILRPSAALGDTWWVLGNGDTVITTVGVNYNDVMRIIEGGGGAAWAYDLLPNYVAGVLTLDSDNYNFGGIGIPPYDFTTTVNVPAAPTLGGTATLGMTDWVDVSGNVLLAEAAPDGTLLPNDLLNVPDEIIPHNMVFYGLGGDDLYIDESWSTADIVVATPDIGRYYFQRSLLNGPDVDMGVVPFFVPTYWFGAGAEEGAEGWFAFSPTDVPMGGHWSWSWVEAMYELGLTNGIGAGLYGPDVVMTRAQMAAFLSRSMVDLYGLAPMTSTAFSDVPATNFAAADIANLRGYGITAGCGGNNYCPDAAVTRAEMAKFIELTFRTIEFYAPGSVGGWVDQTIFSPGFTFIDVPAGHWANIWIEELFWDGMTTGCTRDNLNLYFCPEDTVTRGQMAKFITSAILGGPGAVQTFWPILAPER